MNVLGYSLNITEALLGKLDELFPNKLPTNSITIEELAFLQGQRYVVDTLYSIYNQQFEKD